VDGEFIERQLAVGLSPEQNMAVKKKRAQLALRSFFFPAGNETYFL